jgi:hypothetical protein
MIKIRLGACLIFFFRIFEPKNTFFIGPMSGKTECVKVAVRCRPLNGREKQDNRSKIVSMDVSKGTVFVKNPAEPNEPPKSWTFDYVYDES